MKKNVLSVGLCKRMCSYQKEQKKLYKAKAVYAAFAKDEKLIKKSASGGIFASIAEEFIKQGGIVYGSAMQIENGKATVKHIRVEDLANLYKLQGSKYVQSDLKEIFGLIKKDLEIGNKVLFSGTPCQVDAINSFINNEKLFTIDIICHGVPNNKMFNDYLKTLEKVEKANIIDFQFRDKTKGWGLFASYIVNKNNKNIKILKPAYELSYYQLFLDSKIYRKNCYSCPYAKESRCSDITLGDYWGIEKEHPNISNSFNIVDGVSCVLVNSEKGKKIINDFSDRLILFNSEINKVSKHNKQLRAPSFHPNDREEILKIYNKYGFDKLDAMYKNKNFVKIFIKKIMDILPVKIRKIIKNGVNK